MAVTENAKVIDIAGRKPPGGDISGRKPPGGPVPADEDRARILHLLQQAARVIDRMWLAAQTDGEHSAAVPLGEASHGVHRALIALSEATPPPE